MKKVLFFLTFVLTGGFCFGQTLQKGNLLGLHVSAINLKEGVTMEQYIEFFTNKVTPAYDKAFPGTKIYLIKSLRGKDSTSFGTIYMFDSEADRNKYIKDGATTELFNTIIKKLEGINKEWDKYVTHTESDSYNDWLVQ